MGQAELHEAVARAIDDAWATATPPRPVNEFAAAAAIRVCMVEALRSIEALRDEWVHDGSSQAVLGAALNVLRGLEGDAA